MTAQGKLIDAGALRAWRDRDRDMHRDEVLALEAVMSTEKGREFYCRVVFDMCGLETESFAWNIKDGHSASLITAHAEGRRWVGRQLFLEARDAFPELVRKMLAEQFKREEAESLREQRKSAPAGEDTHDS